MASSALFAPVLLACFAAGLSGQEDAQALIQNRLTFTNPYFDNEQDYYFLTEEGLNISAMWIKDIFRKHGPLLSNLLDLSNASSGALPRSESAKCSAGDIEQMRKAMLFQAPLLDSAKASCNTDALCAPEGFEHGLLQKCFQESQLLSMSCSSCFLDLAANIIGSPADTGCSAHCARWASSCKEREDGGDAEKVEKAMPDSIVPAIKVFMDENGEEFFMKRRTQEEPTKCDWFMAGCYECAEKHIDSFLTCTDMPQADTFKQAFSDLTWAVKGAASKDMFRLAQTIVNAPTVNGMIDAFANGKWLDMPFETDENFEAVEKLFDEY